MFFKSLKIAQIHRLLDLYSAAPAEALLFSYSSSTPEIVGELSSAVASSDSPP